VLYPSGRGGDDPAPVRKHPARAQGPRLARDPGARNRRRSARHQHCRLQAPGLRHQFGDHGGGGRAVLLLPRLRPGRGVLAVPHHPVSGHGDHRRHGLAARCVARRDLRHHLFLYYPNRPARAAGGATLCQPAVRGELRRVRARDDPVPGLRTVGAGGHLASYPELFPVVAVQAPLRVGIAPMTSALLAIEKLEVVYQRAITAVQGITLAVEAGQIVALLGTNGAGKSTTLRAISGFLGLDDARVTEGAITFKGTRIENRPPHENTQRGIVLVPARDKVFPNLTVAENLIAPVPRGTSLAEHRRREALVCQFFPRLGELKTRIGGLLSGGERQMLALASALVCRPELLL